MRYMKTKLKELVTILMQHQLPTPMAMKFLTLVVGGIIAFIVGTVFLIVNGITKAEFSAFLFPVILGIVMLLYGCFYKLNIVKTGWVAIDGICIDLIYTFNHIPSQVINAHRRIRGRTPGPDAFIMSTSNELFYILITQKKYSPQVGTKIRLYISKNAKRYTGANGYIHIDPVYGYVILPGIQNGEIEKEKELT